MSAKELPEVVADPGPPPRGSGHRLGLGLLLIAVAVATVVIPRLVAPGTKAAPAPAASIPPLAQLFPAATVTASPPESMGGTAAKPCSPAGVSCAVYATGLGKGWSATGDGLTVRPGATAPETGERAIQVDRSSPATSHTAFSLVAHGSVAIKAGAQLSLRVWGAAPYGTVLKLSAAPAGTGSVTLNAPAGRWSAYKIKLAELMHGSSLSRIQLVVSTDQVPDVNRFFVDDIALG